MRETWVLTALFAFCPSTILSMARISRNTSRLTSLFMFELLVPQEKAQLARLEGDRKLVRDA
jgi:hypothetical protein